MLNRINALKTLAAIMVVGIHITAYIKTTGNAEFWNYYIYRGILEFAVPFFFATSGYLIAKKNKEYLSNYAKKIFSIFMAASVFYLIYKYLIIVVEWLIKNNSLKESTIIFIKKIDLKVFMQGTFGEFHLWYLMATVIAVVIFAFIKGIKDNINLIFLISSFVYISYITEFIDFSSVAIWGGFPKAMFYISLGMYIKQLDLEKIKNPLFKSLIFIFAFSGIYAITQAKVIEVFLALGIFYILIWGAKEEGKKTILSKMSKQSLPIYIMHVFVYNATYKIMNYLGMDVDKFKSNEWNLLIILVLCVVASIFIYKIFEKVLLKPIEKALSDLYKKRKEKE